MNVNSDMIKTDAKIKIQTTTGSCTLWAKDFQEALQVVKSISERKYDASIKTWILPITTKVFIQIISAHRMMIEEEDFQEAPFNPFKKGSKENPVSKGTQEIAKKLGWL